MCQQYQNIARVTSGFENTVRTHNRRFWLENIYCRIIISIVNVVGQKSKFLTRTIIPNVISYQILGGYPEMLPIFSSLVGFPQFYLQVNCCIVHCFARNPNWDLKLGFPWQYLFNFVKKSLTKIFDNKGETLSGLQDVRSVWGLPDILTMTIWANFYGIGKLIVKAYYYK